MSYLIHPPVRHDPSFEQIGPGEAEAVASVTESLLKIARITHADEGRGLRAVHAKSHALLQGELRVLDYLPAELQQGLLQRPARYPVVMRLSTTPGDLLDDRVSTPRGLALKVLDVKGPRLPGSERDSSQDFLMVNSPAFLQRDASSFARSLKLLAATTDKAEGAKRLLSAVLRGAEHLLDAVDAGSGTLKALGGEPLHHPLGETYFTQLPFLYGAYMAKLCLVPVSPQLRALTGAPVDLRGRPDGLREAAHAFFAAHAAEWELRVQLCIDVDRMPIEDATMHWPETHSPYIAVAQIHVPRQPAWTPELTPAQEDALFFSPWHGLAAHRPLGSINRVRKAAYEASGHARAERNGVAHGAQCPFHRLL